MWLKKDDLAKVVKLMDIDNPPERIWRAIDFAKHNVIRCKQARAFVPLVYSFTIKQWFHMHDKEA